MTRRMVVDLADRRPIWRLPEAAAEMLRDALPSGWGLDVVDAQVDGTGDGVPGASPEALELVAGAEVYVGYGVPGAILRAGQDLRWVHTGTGGVGGSLGPELRERDDVLFTNSAGVHAPPVADTVLAMMLHFSRGLDYAVRSQARGQWGRAPFDTAESDPREIDGSAVGVIGFGGIGREVARRVVPLGARVLGLKRTPAEAPPGVELCYGREGLERIIRECRYVVVTAPETDETRGMLDRRSIENMRPDSVLINVSRGSLLDQDALVLALREKRLRGAGLDVFAREPLPPSDPLWKMENVLITPHVSAYTDGYWGREIALITDNLERYVDGRALRNLVDRAAGY